MPFTCPICGEMLTAQDAVVRCTHEDYSAQELELMGLDGSLAPMTHSRPWNAR